MISARRVGSSSRSESAISIQPMACALVLSRKGLDVAQVIVSSDVYIRDAQIWDNTAHRRMED
jgi:hypothetical protein